MTAGSQALTRGSLAAAATSSVALAARAGQVPRAGTFVWLPRGAGDRHASGHLQRRRTVSRMTARPHGLDGQIAKNFRKALWDAWGPGVSCWFCGHRIIRGCGEIEHRISPSLRPDLAFATSWRGEQFLVPVHGGGKRRCPEPGCDLDCNAIAGGNAAPRDELGRSARWPPEFLARKQEERRTYQAREGRTSVARRNGRSQAPPPAREPAPEPEPQRRVYADVGREWLLWVIPVL